MLSKGASLTGASIIKHQFIATKNSCTGLGFKHLFDLYCREEMPLKFFIAAVTYVCVFCGLLVPVFAEVNF